VKIKHGVTCTRTWCLLTHLRTTRCLLQTCTISSLIKESKTHYFKTNLQASVKTGVFRLTLLEMHFKHCNTLVTSFWVKPPSYWLAGTNASEKPAACIFRAEVKWSNTLPRNLGFYQPTHRRFNPRENHENCHCCENLKSHKVAY
jgi:hypothetical protein